MSDSDPPPLVLSAADRAAVRAEDMETVVLPAVRQRFEADPELRSALFVVSQYWNDNASDEVHGVLVLSRASVPRWPHECVRWGPGAPARVKGADACSRCLHDEPYFQLPYAEPQWRAWEAYAPEHANQEQDLADAYVPHALFRRQSGGGVEVERVGHVVRPWLDAPDPAPPGAALPELALAFDAPDDAGARHVLADVLLERGDPRGEYLALALSPAPTSEERARARALLVENERRWLGPLAAIVPRGGAAFVDGFPERVSVYVPPSAPLPESLADEEFLRAREWATVRALVFLPTSRSFVSPAMKSLRDVGPLGADAIVDVGAAREAWSIERIQLDDTFGGLERVRPLLAEPSLAERLPRLRTLVVSGSFATPDLADLLAGSKLWSALDALHVAPSVRFDQRRVDPTALEAWLARDAGVPPELAFGQLGAAGAPAGAWLHVRRAAARRAWITMPAWGSRHGLVELAETIGGLAPALRASLGTIELRASPCFEPTPADVVALREAEIDAALSDA